MTSSPPRRNDRIDAVNSHLRNYSRSVVVPEIETHRSRRRALPLPPQGMRKNALADGIAASANARSGAPANIFNGMKRGVCAKIERNREIGWKKNEGKELG